MRQDQTGCRRIALEGGLGCLVVILSLMALIMFGLRGEREVTTEPVQEQSSPAHDDALRDSLEEALRESGVER